jgi:hypothetical protein
MSRALLNGLIKRYGRPAVAKAIGWEDVALRSTRALTPAESMQAEKAAGILRRLPKQLPAVEAGKIKRLEPVNKPAPPFKPSQDCWRLPRMKPGQKRVYKRLRNKGVSRDEAISVALNE